MRGLGCGWFVVVVMPVFSSCESLSSSASPPQAATVVTAPRRQALTTTSAAAVGEVGTACLAGRHVCQTGLCLHVDPHPDRGYVCTASCRDERNCPAGWRCGARLAGQPERWCVPPPDWVAQPVAPVEPLLVPEPAPLPLAAELESDGGVP